MEAFRWLRKTLFWFDVAFIMVILTFMMIAVFIVTLHDEMEKQTVRKLRKWRKNTEGEGR